MDQGTHKLRGNAACYRSSYAASHGVDFHLDGGSGWSGISAGRFCILASIPSIILLATAIFTVHLPYGFSSIKLIGFTNGRAQFGPPGYECDLLYIACIVSLVLAGPSLWSVDSYRKRDAPAS